MPFPGRNKHDLGHVYQPHACHGNWCCIMPEAACQLDYGVGLACAVHGVRIAWRSRTHLRGLVPLLEGDRHDLGELHCHLVLLHVALCTHTPQALSIHLPNLTVHLHTNTTECFTSAWCKNQQNHVPLGLHTHCPPHGKTPSHFMASLITNAHLISQFSP